MSVDRMAGTLPRPSQLDCRISSRGQGLGCDVAASLSLVGAQCISCVHCVHPRAHLSARTMQCSQSVDFCCQDKPQVCLSDVCTCKWWLFKVHLMGGASGRDMGPQSSLGSPAQSTVSISVVQVALACNYVLVLAQLATAILRTRHDCTRPAPSLQKHKQASSDRPDYFLGTDSCVCRVRPDSTD